MKLFELKRFFVVTLLLSLGITQGWGQDIKTSTWNMPAKKKTGSTNVYNWEQDGIKFNLTESPGVDGSSSDQYYSLSDNKTIEFKWNNENHAKYDLVITKFYIESCVVHATGVGNSFGSIKFYLTDDFQYTNAKRVANRNTWTQGTIDVTDGNIRNDDYLTITVTKGSTWPASNKSLHKIDVTYYFLYTYQAKANAIAGVGGLATGVTSEKVKGHEESKTFDNLKITAIPNDDYVFVGWSKTQGGEIINDSKNMLEYTVSINCDKEYSKKLVEDTWYANFATKRSILEWMNKFSDEEIDYLMKSNKVKNAKVVSDLDNLNVVILKEFYDEGEQQPTVTPDTKYDVIVVKRTLKGGGTWNTLCLPFAWNKSMLDGAVVKELSGVDYPNEKSYNLHFTEVDDNETLSAGTPYMVKVDGAAITEFSAEGEIVVNTNTTAMNATKVGEPGKEVIFNGNFDPCFVPENSYIISNNTFYFVDVTDLSSKGFRGWFELGEGTPSTDDMAFSASFDDDVTGITSVNEHEYENDNLYNIAGIRVNENAKGIIIKNGKKYLVK